MGIRGCDGAWLGVVERFEIDEQGQLIGIVTESDPVVGRKQIAAARILGVRFGTLVLALDAAEFDRLPGAVAAPPGWRLDDDRGRIGA